MVQWLDNTFPSWLMGIFIVGGGALATWLAVRFRHSRVKPGEPDADNDLTEVFVLVVTTMYAVLLAFIIFTVWTNYDNAQQASSVEGGAVTSLAHQSIALPKAEQQEMLLALRAYSESVIRDEWPTMAHGQSSPVTTDLFNHVFVVADSLSAAGSSSDVATELTTLSNARTKLLLYSGSALPDAFWFVLIVGAVIGIGLSVLFFTESPRAHRLMAVAAAVVICTGIWLILELDYPLSGDTAFKPDAFDRAIYVINTIQAGHYGNPAGVQ